VGIAAILTKNDDSAPPEQHQINFEDEPAGSRSSPFAVNGGFFFTYFVTSNAEASNEVAEADFAGDNLYEPSHGSITYDVQLDQDGLGGVGGSDGGSGAGTTQTGRSCTGSCDLEKDAIPDAEETQGFVDDAIAPGLKWFFPVASDKTKVDIYYEIDCMAGVTCLTQVQADYIERRFDLRGIKMHVDIDETGICGPSAVNPVHVWDDADANECNDFKSIKLNHYGTPAERANGDLGSGNGLLTLKHLVSRYMLITYNTNSGTNQACGTTGVGELIGNDAVVSVECLLVTANPASKPQILLGTVMHEMGHNLGLKHGGTDDINCKCNYISLMNYQGQMPTTDRPVPGVNQATNVGWYGDYSHGPLLYQTSGGTNIGDGKKITEGATLADGNKLVLSGSTWKAADGVDITSEVTVTQFKLLWSDTTPNAVQPIKSALTGAAINWNGIAGLTAIQDINYLTVKVGSKQLPACTQSSELTDLVSPVDDYATIKANVAKAMDQATDLLGISEHGLQDPDLIPEMNLHIFEELNSVSFHSPGVESPLSNVGFGDPALSKIKKGSTVNVKFDLFDDQGNEVTGSNSLSQYLIDRIDLRIALVTAAGTPPEDSVYFSPPTSTQPGSLDRFSFDGSKWSLSYGTKNLVTNGDYTARIVLRFTTGEIFVLDNRNDGVDNISFNFKIVKG
jgi:hypothetical protein